MLDDLDRELERRGLRFVRYADDCNIYVRSRRAGERVMASVTRFLTDRLKLKVNESKSAVARPAERKFLGFSFTSGRAEAAHCAEIALAVQEAHPGTDANGTAASVWSEWSHSLARYLTAGAATSASARRPRCLTDLDSWIRRRLRCFQWKQWKRGTTRFAELRKRGVGKDLAAQTAGSSRGLWHISRSPALQHRLAQRLLRLARTSPTGRNQTRLTNRTAVVRTRMPGGVIFKLIDK